MRSLLRLLRITSLSTSLLVVMLCMMSQSVLASDDEQVNIVISSNNKYQRLTATSIHFQLNDIDIPSAIISLDELEKTPHTKKTVYIAVGEPAIAAVKQSHPGAPLLRISNTPIKGDNYNSTQAHLVLEQTQCREVELIKILNDDWRSIAILSSVNSVEKAAELTRCAIRFNINLNVYAIREESDLARTLERAVKNNDGILSIADPLIYNRHTIKNILLTTYRSRRPIIGYSESFIDAGAIAGIFTSPDSAGERAAQIISDFIDNHWQFNSKLYYPTDFTIKTNPQVARSLEIDLPDVSDITYEILNTGEL